MSPAPARTSRDAIVAAARSILEEDGPDGVTMTRVAERIGIRGPSLYKHVDGRPALIRAVADDIVADLACVLATAAPGREPRRALLRAVAAYRAFVHANPNGYALLFVSQTSDRAPDPTVLAELARPLIDAMARLVGDDRALSATRTLVAWAHGFVSMELAGAFRLGGDLDAAYDAGARAILDGVSGSASPGRG